MSFLPHHQAWLQMTTHTGYSSPQLEVPARPLHHKGWSLVLDFFCPLQSLAWIKWQVTSSPSTSTPPIPFVLVHPIHIAFGEFIFIPRSLKGLIQAMMTYRVQYNLCTTMLLRFRSSPMLVLHISLHPTWWTQGSHRPTTESYLNKCLSRGNLQPITPFSWWVNFFPQGTGSMCTTYPYHWGIKSSFKEFPYASP